MAIADLDAYLELLHSKQQLIPFVETLTNTVLVCDGYTLAAGAGPTPTTGVVPGRTDAGALGQQNGGGTPLRFISANVTTRPSSVNQFGQGMIWVCDRLSHQAGLSLTTTGEQTTNLPTAALTRYTDGIGVMCALTFYATGSAVNPAGTVTLRYTMGGVGSKTTPLLAMPAGAVFNGRMHLIPCEAGGLGFQSVEGVTLSGAGAIAGNFGVTLFKPLFGIVIPPTRDPNSSVDLLTGQVVGAFTEILDDACLFTAYSAAAGTNDNTAYGVIQLGVE